MPTLDYFLLDYYLLEGVVAGGEYIVPDINIYVQKIVLPIVTISLSLPFKLNTTGNVMTIPPVSLVAALI